jgi:hypothetical protein
MVVCVVDSPKLHPGCFEAAAFLSESSNRVTITGINLRRGSDPILVSEAKGYPDIRDVSPIRRRESGERKNEHVLV